MSRIDESGRDGAIGRRRRLVRLVTAAACVAIGPAALATPAHAGSTPTLPAGTAITQLVAAVQRDLAVLVSVLGPGGQVTAPQQVLTGDALPLVLPGASFYDFPAGDIAAFPDGALVVAAPLWRSGRGVIDLAAGVPGGSWRVLTVGPPRGADLLLPALGTLSRAGVLLVCAVHVRAGDRLGYDSADLSISAHGPVAAQARLAPLTPSPTGPGFFELGEDPGKPPPSLDVQLVERRLQ